MRILILILLVYSNLVKSQTLDEFNKISLGIDSSFTDFELKIGKSSVNRETNFGLEKRVYDYNTFNLIVYEKDDSAGIDEIVFLSKKQFENKESWYNICKVLNVDSSFVKIDSMISSPEDGIYKTNLKFETIVSLLRKANDLSDYMYYVVYKKGILYYEMNMINTSLLIRISKNFESPLKK
ncbi:hypothetical protein MP478_04570 [Chryseobacterium sp. WG14]|uniref:hypothetical protein n=1 Tax=Chryseobacterium sp. WG14 TaxID=2926909 RepID=UPI00211DF93D|nr:hypothetical protein [Chryseobacterium sp. WG14]MCQ9638654.1 hypothetical protein [Chryseobacterium sp. WG14]